MLLMRNKRLVSMILVMSLWISCISVGFPHAIAYADDSSQPTTVSGLVGEWKFDEVSMDGISPDTLKRNNAILTDAAIGSGKVGKALLLNGYLSYATVPNQNLINTGSDFSMSLLVNFNSTYTNRDVVIVQQQGEGGETLLSRRADGRLQSSLGGKTTIGATLIEPKKWYHVALSREGDQVKLYVNGALETASDDTLLVSNNGDFRIGADREPEVTNAWPGYIDEFKIYDKALTDEEMKQVPGFNWPIISLNGNSEISLSLNDTYVESGAQASDSKDGDITADIQTTGLVDTSKGGIYKVNYTVSNQAGDSVTKVRTVTVIPPKTLSRASRVLIDKGLQMQTWMTTDQSGRKYASAEEWKNSHFTTATYYENPGYNQMFHNQVPEAQWSFVKGAFGDGLGGGPKEKDMMGFLSDAQKANVDKLITISFGDEENYSNEILKTFTDWFKLSHELYPDVLAHSNQQSRQWQRDDYETYIRTAKPDLLTFDDYLFSTRGSDNNLFTTIVNNINDQRTIALKGYDGTGQSPIAFGQYLLGFKTGEIPADVGPYIITESQIYGVPFATLTMGGKWLSMFRWEYDSNTFLFFDKDGKPTKQYEQYAEMARQINNLGPHLVRLNSTDVSILPGQHKDSNGRIVKNLTPRETPVFDKNTQLKHPYLRSVVSKNSSVQGGLNGDVMLGFFEPLPDTESFFNSTDMEYFMVMNGLTSGNGKTVEQHGEGAETEQTIMVQLNLAKYNKDAIKKVSRLTGDLEPVELTPIGGNLYQLEVVLNGGVADLFQLDKTKVNLEYIAANAISLPETLTMDAGDTEAIEAVVLPAGATEKSVDWYTSNEQIATVDSNGKVTAIAGGKAVITAISVDGNKKATTSITVTSDVVPVTGIKVSPSTGTLYTNETMKLTAEILPSNATNKAYEWFSSNADVAAVDQSGKVFAKLPGSAEISARTLDGRFVARSTITVLDANSEASLSELVISGGKENIVFNSEIYDYTTRVNTKVDAITIQPRLKNKKGTMTVNDIPVISGQKITAKLPMGNSKIVFVTKAADGMTTKTYTLTVKRNKNVALEATVVSATYLNKDGEPANLIRNDYDNSSEHSPLKFADGDEETYFQSAAITNLNPKGEFNPAHRIMLQWDDDNLQDFNKLVLVVNNAQQQGITVIDTETSVNGTTWQELNAKAYKPTWQTDSQDIYESVTIDLPNYKEYYGEGYKGLKGIYLLLWAANLNTDHKYAISEFELYNEQDAAEPVELTLGEIPGTDPENPNDSVIADWVFSEANVQPGTSIEAGNLFIKDRSGKGNDLKMAVAGAPGGNRLSFTDDGALDFANDKKDGQYLTTVEGAPINRETFDKGFTIEAEFKLGSSINNWMGILTRQGNNTFDPGEQEPLSTLSISSIREVQWASTHGNSSSNELQSNWSNSLSAIKAWVQSDEYTHVAIVNDGSKTRLFLNGIESIRNPETDEIINGIAAEAGMGWNVGAYEWDRAPNSLFLGKIKHIRVSSKALEKDQFIKTEFNYKVDYGTNNDLPMFAQDTYTFAIIPDPQYVVQSKPDILEKQLQFIADNYVSKNIAMTVNVGDTTQSSAAKEWASADKAYKILDKANVPYIVTRGNHDLNGSGYLDTMGPNRFAGTEHFKGASPSGLSTYSIITAGSYKYMFLAVDSVGNNSSNTKEREWAKTVLNENPKMPTVIFSHNIMTIDGNGQVSEGGQGSLFWRDLVENYDQVFMMVGGHISGAGLNVKKKANGNEVLQVLTDYQSDIAGGNGWTSFFEFDEKSKEIRVKTFSPYVDSIPVGERSYLDTKFLTGPGDMYNIPFDFSTRFRFAKNDEVDVVIPDMTNDKGLINLVPKVDARTGEAKAVVEERDWNKALSTSSTDDDGVKTVKVEVQKADKAKAYVVELPKAALNSNLVTHLIEITTAIGTITVPANMLNGQDLSGAKTVSLVIASVEKTSLDPALQEQIGDRPIIEVDVYIDGAKAAWSNPQARVRISVPYTPSDAELADSEHIVAGYINNIGKASTVSNSRYEPSTKTVTFTTTHFSKYAIMFVHKTFDDLDNVKWAKKQIEVLATKGIINGTSVTKYNPSATITRADFIVLLVKALELTAPIVTNFDDVSLSSYYYNEVMIAKKLGITKGSGDNKFNPLQPITRQDAFVLLHEAMKAAGMKLNEGTSAGLDRFNDKAKVASYAMESLTALIVNGIVKGNGNSILPLAPLSRAESAVIVYNMINK